MSKTISDPCPKATARHFLPIRDSIINALAQAQILVENGDVKAIISLRKECDLIKDTISRECHGIYDHLRNGATGNLTVAYVYLNTLQESQEMMSGLRKLLRATSKLRSNDPVARVGAA